MENLNLKRLIKNKKQFKPYISKSKSITVKPINSDIEELNKNVNKTIEKVQVNPPRVDIISDNEGLKRAYATDKGLYKHGQTLYIAGTKSFGDVVDDVLRIPLYGNSRNIQRYKDAREFIDNNSDIRTVVGHSLGGQTALELEKNYSHIQNSRTYGAPVFDIAPHIGANTNDPDRFRHFFDPVSMFDQKAQKTFKTDLFDSKTLTHAHGELSDKNYSTATLRGGVDGRDFITPSSVATVETQQPTV